MRSVCQLQVELPQTGVKVTPTARAPQGLGQAARPSAIAAQSVLHHSSEAAGHSAKRGMATCCQTLLRRLSQKLAVDAAPRNDHHTPSAASSRTSKATAGSRTPTPPQEHTSSFVREPFATLTRLAPSEKTFEVPGRQETVPRAHKVTVACARRNPFRLLQESH